MDWKQMTANIVAWEEKVSKLYPLKIVFAVCVILILWQLSSIKEELRSVKRELRDVSWVVSDIESDVSNIESVVSDIESVVSNIEYSLP